MLTPATCRAARALVDWTQFDLGSRAGVPAGTVRDFEAGEQALTARESNAIVAVFEAAGLELLNHEAPGVRLKPVKGKTRK